MPDLQQETQTTKPLVALVPYYLNWRGNLGDVALADLTWPLGVPDDIEGKTVADLGPNDHIFSYPRYWVYGPRARGFAARFSLAIVEPRSFHGHHLRLAGLFQHRFHRILTADDRLLSRAPNAVPFVFGDSWVAPEGNFPIEKRQMVSLIASRKNALEGHRLRHKVVKAAKARGLELTAMGAGYLPFEKKSDGLAPFRFSVVIENSSEPRYFTEKLIDAFLCETVPIYWGATRIAEYFDPKGMILCRSQADILAAVSGLSEAQYQAMRPAILSNKAKALEFVGMEKRAARLLATS